MKMKKILIGVAIFWIATSCSNWFDVTSSTTVKEKELFKNEQGFRDVFTGIYTLLTTESLYGKELTYGYNDVRAKYWNITKADHNYYKAMSYDYTDNTQVSRINSFWERLYKAISNVNSILANIDNDKSIFAPGMYNVYKGEAHALRAMLHFEVLRLYGKSPKEDGAMSSKAIPYYEQVTNIAQPLLSMEDVFGKIRTDIASARELLRDYDNYGPAYSSDIEVNRGVKMNYWATTALLARMELYAGNKSAALSAAKEIIGEAGEAPKAPFEINNNGMESNRLFNSELIFALNIKTLEDMTDPQFGEDATVSSSSTGLMMRERDYNNLFKLANAADIEYRKTLWVKSVDATNYTVSKYNKVVSVPMFRLSELYYIAAESVSDSETALSYLNTIRAGRGLSPLVSSSNLNDELKTEYMREFIGEGQLFYYFKRLGATSGIGVLNKTIKLEQYVLPLPNEEVEFGKIE